MDMESLHDHYHQPNLTDRILAALRKAGVNTEKLTRDDLDQLDEFHIRGRAATVELAALAALSADHVVLDLGCGVGGPARFLAAEYGCRVTGLDLVAAYCDAATELTCLVGLADRVDFRQGDMREMPFDDNSFDRIWSQHTIMNIPDKAAFAAEVRRVLRPGGKAVFYEVCAGNGEPVHLPVAWAGTPEHSYLVAPSEFQEVMAAAGLREEMWEDVTGAALAWADGMQASLGNKPADARSRPGLGLLMGPAAVQKGKNLLRSLREERITIVRGIFTA